MRIYILSIILFILTACSSRTGTPQSSKSQLSDNNETSMQFIVSSDLVITGSFDFGTVSQGVTASQIVTYKNNGKTTGKLQPDLTNISQSNGIFNINYANSDCLIANTYKVLNPGQTCQIELIMDAGQTTGPIFTGIPLYDTMNNYALVATTPVSVIINTPVSSLNTNQTKSCQTNYHNDLITNKCVSDYKDCTASITNAITATKHWNSITKSFGECITSSCAKNYAPASTGTSCVLVEPTATVTINSPSVINILNQSNYTISGTCSINGNAVNVSIGTISSSATCSNLTWTKTLDVSLAIDSNILSISATHSGTAGNSATITASTLKDTISPILTNNQASLISNGGQITLLGSCEGSLQITSTESSNNSNNINCSNNLYSIPYSVVSGVDGVKNVVLTETDLAGNTSSITVSYTLDKTPPTVYINNLSSITATNASNYSISGTCSENGQVIFISATDSTSTLNYTANCNANAWSTSVSLMSLKNGLVLITAAISDLAANSASISQNVTKNYINPNYALPSTTFTQIPYSLSSFNSLPSDAINAFVYYNSTYYAATSNGLAISTDNGATWLIKNTSNGLSSNYLWGLATYNSTIVLGTLKNGVSISTDNGKTWINSYTPWINATGSTSGARILAVNSSGIYAQSMSNTGLLYKSSDNGTTWVKLTSFPTATDITKLLFVGNTLYAATSNGIVFSSDGGTTWSYLYSAAGVTDFAFDGSYLYLISNGNLIESTNNGATWVTKTGLPSSLINVEVLNSKVIVQAGTKLGISNDYGSTWTTNTYASIGDSYQMAAFNSTILVASVNQGLTYTNDYGSTWNSIREPKIIGNSNFSYNAVGNAFVNGTNLYVTTANGLSVSNDSGATWSFIPNSSSLTVARTSIVLATDNYILIGTGSVLYVSSDYGITWIKKTAATIGNSSISAFNCMMINGSKIFIGTDKGLYSTTDYGTTFSTLWSNKYIDSLSHNGNIIYAASEVSGLRKSTDNGITWVSKGPSGTTTATMIYSDGSNLYLGTDQGLYTSTNEGDAWTLMTSTVGKSFTNGGFAAFNGVLYIGSLISINAGTSWIDMSYNLGTYGIPGDGNPPSSTPTILIDKTNSLVYYFGTYGMAVTTH